MMADRLKLNDERTEFMIIGTRTQLDNVNVSKIVVSQAKVLQSKTKVVGKAVQLNSSPF